MTFRKFTKAHGDKIWLNLYMAESIEPDGTTFVFENGQDRDVKVSKVTMFSGREVRIQGTPEEIVGSRNEGEANTP